jgi:hypothetical protein
LKNPVNSLGTEPTIYRLGPNIMLQRDEHRIGWMNNHDFHVRPSFYSVKSARNNGATGRVSFHKYATVPYKIDVIKSVFK